MRILIDMDDVLENMCEVWVAELNRLHGLDMSYEDIQSWEISQSYWMLSKEQVFAPLGVPEFWDLVTPIDGAVEAVQKLQQDGHDIYVVTASDPGTINAKMEKVLFRYFPFIDWKHVIVAAHKQLVKGDVLIDDGAHNLIGGDYFKILMDQPHNRKFDEVKHGVYRAKSWGEIYDVVTMYTKEIVEFRTELDLVGMTI